MRLLNRLLAALLALALIAVGALVIVETVADRFDHRPAIVKWHGAFHWAAHTHWQQGSVRVTGIIITALALLLLIAELKRPRVTRLAVTLNDDQAAIDAAYTRSGVAAAIHTAVTDVDGVRGAQVKVTRRSIRVRAATAARDHATAQQLLSAARTAAEQRLTALRLHRTPKLTVATTARKR